MEDNMKRLSLLLCALVLVGSADLFARDSQRPRVRPRCCPADPSVSVAIDREASGGSATTARPLRTGLLGFQDELVLRAILRYIGALDDASTNRPIETRLTLSSASER
jgi:hypothetical protein